MVDIQKQMEEERRRDANKQFAREKAEASGAINKVLFELRGLRKFFWQVVIVLFWIWKNLLWPFSVWLSPLAVGIFNWYRRLWTKFTIRKDKLGIDRFSKKRGIALALTTFVSVVFLFNLALFTFDATIWTMSNKTEDYIYLYRSEDAFDNDGIYSVSGCEITNPAFKQEVVSNLNQALVDAKTIDLACKDVNGLYFRVQFSWFDWFYRLVKTGQIFYYPDLVHSSIATNWNICKTDNYGYRWRWMMGLGWEQLYPKLLVTECHSIGN